MHEVDLAAAADLAQARLADQRRVPFAHEGLDREPLGRRRRDQRQIAQAAERHVQRARNRRRRQRQHVDLGAQRLQPLLVAHAEAVFLVDDHEAEVLEARVALQQPVRGDHDVDGAVRRCREHGLGRFGAGAKARQHLDAHRPVGEAIGEVSDSAAAASSVVGTSTATCLPALTGDEGGAQRDLGLAEADVAADHAIHGLAGAQVGEHLVDRLRLVRGFLERESCRANARYSASPRPRGSRPGARRGANTDRGAPRRRRGCARRPCCAPSPMIAAELVQRRRLGRRAAVARPRCSACTGTYSLSPSAYSSSRNSPTSPADLHGRAGRGSGRRRRSSCTTGAPMSRSVSSRRIVSGSRSRAAPAPLLPGALAEQLLLGEHGEARLRREEPSRSSAATVSAKRIAPRRSRASPRPPAACSPWPRSSSSSTSRWPAESAASSMRPASRRGSRASGAVGCADALVEAHSRCGGACEVVYLRFRPRSAAASTSTEAHAASASSRARELAGRQVQVGRRQDRPLAVVAQLLVALDRCRSRRAMAAGTASAATTMQRRRRQIVEQRARCASKNSGR